MKQFLWIISFFVLLVKCIGLDCPTCQGLDCFKPRIQNLTCDNNFPALPFQVKLKPRRNHGDNQYGCLELHYYTGKTLYTIKQCFPVIQNNCVCKQLKQIVHVKQCILSGKRQKRSKQNSIGNIDCEEIDNNKDKRETNKDENEYKTEEVDANTKEEEDEKKKIEDYYNENKENKMKEEEEEQKKLAKNKKKERQPNMGEKGEKEKEGEQKNGNIYISKNNLSSVVDIVLSFVGNSPKTEKEVKLPIIQSNHSGTNNSTTLTKSTKMVTNLFDVSNITLKPLLSTTKITSAFDSNYYIDRYPTLKESNTKSTEIQKTANSKYFSLTKTTSYSNTKKNDKDSSTKPPYKQTEAQKVAITVTTEVPYASTTKTTASSFISNADNNSSKKENKISTENHIVINNIISEAVPLLSIKTTTSENGYNSDEKSSTERNNTSTITPITISNERLGKDTFSSTISIAYVIHNIANNESGQHKTTRSEQSNTSAMAPKEASLTKTTSGKFVMTLPPRQDHLPTTTQGVATTENITLSNDIFIKYIFTPEVSTEYVTHNITNNSSGQHTAVSTSQTVALGSLKVLPEQPIAVNTGHSADLSFKSTKSDAVTNSATANYLTESMELNKSASSLLNSTQTTYFSTTKTVGTNPPENKILRSQIINIYDSVNKENSSTTTTFLQETSSNPTLLNKSILDQVETPFNISTAASNIFAENSVIPTSINSTNSGKISENNVYNTIIHSTLKEIPDTKGDSVTNTLFTETKNHISVTGSSLENHKHFASTTTQPRRIRKECNMAIKEFTITVNSSPNEEVTANVAVNDKRVINSLEKRTTKLSEKASEIGFPADRTSRVITEEISSNSLVPTTEIFHDTHNESPSLDPTIIENIISSSPVTELPESTKPANELSSQEMYDIAGATPVATDTITETTVAARVITKEITINTFVPSTENFHGTHNESTSLDLTIIEYINSSSPGTESPKSFKPPSNVSSQDTSDITGSIQEATEGIMKATVASRDITEEIPSNTFVPKTEYLLDTNESSSFNVTIAENIIGSSPVTESPELYKQTIDISSQDTSDFAGDTSAATERIMETTVASRDTFQEISSKTFGSTTEYFHKTSEGTSIEVTTIENLISSSAVTKSPKKTHEVSSQDTSDTTGSIFVATEGMIETSEASRVIISSKTFIPLTEYFHDVNESTTREVTIIENINSSGPVPESPESSKQVNEVSSQHTSDMIPGSIPFATEGTIETSVASRVFTEEISSNTVAPTTEYLHKTNEDTSIEITIIESVISSSQVTESIESSKQANEVSSQDPSDITGPIPVATEKIIETTLDSGVITEEIFSNTFIPTTEYFHDRNESTTLEITIIEHIISSSPVTESPELSEQTNEVSSQDTSDLAGDTPVATERIMETTVASKDITEDISSNPFGPTTEYFHKTSEGTSLEVTIAENIMGGSAVTESPESSKQTHEVQSQDTSYITGSIPVTSGGIIETSVASRDITEEVSNNTIVPTTEYFHKMNEGTIIEVTIIENVISSSPVTESIESSKQTNEVSSQDTSDITGSVPVATERIIETTVASRDITEGISCNTVVPTTEYFQKTDEGTIIEVTIVENIISSSTVAESSESSKQTNAVSSQDISDITGSIPVATERIMETKVASRDITEEISSSPFKPTTEYFHKTNEGTSHEVTIAEKIMGGSAVSESPESSKQTHEVSSQDTSDITGSILVATEGIMETTVASSDITEEISSNTVLETTEYFHKTNEGTSIEVTVIENLTISSPVTESPESSKPTHEVSSRDTSDLTGSILVATEGIMETTVASRYITKEISSNTVLETTEYFHKSNEGTSIEVTVIENVTISSPVTESPESSKPTHEVSSRDTSDITGSILVATEGIMETTVASNDITEEISSNTVLETTEYFHKTNEGTSIQVTVIENVTCSIPVTESPESSKQTNEVSSQDTSDITGSILVAFEGIMETTFDSSDITEEISSDTVLKTTEYFHKTNQGASIEVTVIENVTSSSPVTESPESSKPTHEVSSQGTPDITGSILVATEGIMETTVASSDITEEISSNTVLKTTEYFHKTNEGASIEVTVIENVTSSSPVTESPESSKPTHEVSSRDTSDITGSILVATEGIMETTVASSDITEEISSNTVLKTTEYFHKTNGGTSIEVTVIENVTCSSTVTESPESSKQTNEVSSRDTSDITGSILVATEGIMETTAASSHITEEISSNTVLETTEYFHKTNEGTSIEVTVIENVTSSSPVTESPESSKPTHEVSSRDTSDITGSILVATEGIMETTVASSDITEEISSNTDLETTEYFHKTNEGTSIEVTLIENVTCSSPVTESPESSKPTHEVSSQDTSDITLSILVATKGIMETTVASSDITEEISSNTVLETTEYFHKTNEGTSIEVTVIENVTSSSPVTESPESSKPTHEVSSRDTSDITGSILVATKGTMETTVASSDITEEISSNTVLETTEYFHETNEGTSIEVTVIGNVTSSSPVTESPESSKQTHEVSSQDTSDITGSILVATKGIMETTVASSDITEEISSNTVLETTEYFHKTNEGTGIEVTVIENVTSSSPVTESPESSKHTNEVSSQDTSDITGSILVATKGIMETTVASSDITEEISSNTVLETTEYFHKTNEGTSIEVTVIENVTCSSTVTESPESSKHTNEVSSRDTSDITGSTLVATEGIMETTVASSDITEEISSNTVLKTTEYFHKTNEGTSIEVTVIENVTCSSTVTESPESSKHTNEVSSRDTSDITGSILVATVGIMETIVASSDITEEISSNTALDTTEYFHKTNEGTSIEVTLIENVTCSSPVTESPESSKPTHEVSSQDTSDITGSILVATKGIMETPVASSDITEEISSNTVLETTEYFHKTNEGTSIEVTVIENVTSSSPVTESPESSKPTHEVSSRDTSDITGSILVATEGIMETTVASSDITEEISSNTALETTEYFHKTNEGTSIEVTLIENVTCSSPVTESPESSKPTHEVSSQDTPDITGSILVATEGIMETTVASSDITEEISSNTALETTEYFHKTNEGTSIEVTLIENVTSSSPVIESPESSKPTHEVSSRDTSDITGSILVATEGIMETTVASSDITEEISSNTALETTEYFHKTNEGTSIEVTLIENVTCSSPVTESLESSKPTHEVSSRDTSDLTGSILVATEGIMETTVASSDSTEEISSNTVLETTEYFHKTNEGTSIEVTVIENVTISSPVTESPESSKPTHEVSSRDTSDITGSILVATEGIMETTVASSDITEEISSNTALETTEYFHKTNEGTSIEVTLIENVTCSSTVTESPESSKQTNEVSSQDTSDITGSILVATEGIMQTTFASSDITEEISSNTILETTEYFHKTNEGTSIEVTVIENVTCSSTVTESPESSKQTNEVSSQDTSDITGSILVATEGIMETTAASSHITEEISSNTVLETTEYFHKTNEGARIEVTVIENVTSSSPVTESPESSKQTHEVSSQDTSDITGSILVATEGIMETSVASRDISEEVSNNTDVPTTEYFHKTNEGTRIEVTVIENVTSNSPVTESPESSKQTHEVSSQDTSDITGSILVATEGILETTVASSDITEEVSNNTVVPTTEHFHKTNEITRLDVTMIQNIISGSPVTEMTELFKQTFDVSSQGTPDITEEISSNTFKLTTEEFHNSYESTSLDVTIPENMLSSISVTKSPKSSQQTPGISSQDYFDLAETTLVATDGLIETTSVFGVMTKETSSNTLVPVTTEAFHITKEDATIDVMITENVVSSGPVTKFSGSSTQTSDLSYQDISDIAGATQVSTEGILETTATSSVLTKDISSITSAGIKESSEKVLEITSALNNVETASTKSITDRTEPSSETLLLTNTFSTHITTEKIFDIPTTELPVSSQKSRETISPTPDTSDQPFGTKSTVSSQRTPKIISTTTATSESSSKSPSSENEKISSTKSTTESNASSQKISETTIATTENISSTRSTADTTRSSQETTEKQSAPGLSDNLDYDMLNNSLQPTPFLLLSLLPLMMGLLNLILDNFC